MEGTVSWVVRLSVKPGQLETFKTLMEEMVAGTQQEPDALAYEWYIDAAGENVHIYERYASAAATLVHVQGFGERWAARFVECVDVTGFDIYGDPGEDVRSAFTEMNPSYFADWDGFAR